MKGMIGWGVFGTIIAFALIAIVLAIGWNNAAIELENQKVAQEKNNENIYDKVWKTISQKAQITEKYAGDFKAIYTEVMGKRYDGEAKGSPMFKWIQEQNPNFSVEMYKDLSDSIEGQRAEFARVQARLIDIKREHDNLRLKFPSSLVCKKRPEMVIKIVTSSQTDKVFETGKDDNVKLF